MRSLKCQRNLQLASRAIRDLKPGDQIRVKKADGNILETTVQGIKPCIFDEVFMDQLKLRVPSGFYYAIEVPSDFSCTGDVYLLETGVKQ